jgi:orotate phosphoribosyltransferase
MRARTPANARGRKLGAALAAKVRALGAATVIAPAMGGLVIGQEVARQLGVRFIFVEKEEGKLVLRRGFKFSQVKNSRRRGCGDQRRARSGNDRDRSRDGGNVLGVAMLVDRSNGTVDLGVPMFSLIRLNVETFEPTTCRRTWQRFRRSNLGARKGICVWFWLS